VSRIHIKDANQEGEATKAKKHHFTELTSIYETNDSDENQD
jgi:hypothetical protein